MDKNNIHKETEPKNALSLNNNKLHKNINDGWQTGDQGWKCEQMVDDYFSLSWCEHKLRVSMRVTQPLLFLI